MTTCVFKNRDAISSSILDDRAFVYADGFFETMRVIDASVPLLAFHMERALGTAETLKISLDSKALSEQVAYCLSEADKAGTRSAIYKLIVSRGEGGRASYPPSKAETNLYSFLRPYDPVSRSGISLRFASGALPPVSAFAGLKLINRLEYSVAVHGLDLGCSEEALFVNGDNKLVETMHHNLFFIKNNTLYSPNLAGFGVAGVARKVIIERVAPTLNLEVALGEYLADELHHADGVFLTNAIEGVVEAIAVSGMPLRRSPMTIDIQTAMAKYFRSSTYAA